MHIRKPKARATVMKKLRFRRRRPRSIKHWKRQQRLRLTCIRATKQTSTLIRQPAAVACSHGTAPFPIQTIKRTSRPIIRSTHKPGWKHPIPLQWICPRCQFRRSLQLFCICSPAAIRRDAQHGISCCSLPNVSAR